MKATFPHMGNNWVAFKGLLETLGAQVIVPPRITKRTIDLGVKYSPEFVCFPFKVNIGNFIEALEAGADTLVMVGGTGGTCRFGFYNIVQKRILDDLGYKFDMIVFRDDNFWEILFKKFRKIGEDSSISKIIKAFRVLWWKAKVISEIEDLVRFNRAYEKRIGEADRVLEKALMMLDEQKKVKEIKEVRSEIKNLFKHIPKDLKKKPLRIGIIGEVYVRSEPYVNLDIEKELGKMGVLVDQKMSVYKWLKVILRIDLERAWTARRARPYLKVNAGAEDQQSIGHTIKYAKAGTDGVIMLYPFSCMPENIARGILPNVSRRYKIPILTFSLDEQTGKTGMITRLEAFVDLLNRKRRR
ncbi:MAG: CoA protein activase [bacterium]|nr:CoA protein activase [bacterium]